MASFHSRLSRSSTSALVLPLDEDYFPRQIHVSIEQQEAYLMRLRQLVASALNYQSNITCDPQIKKQFEKHFPMRYEQKYPGVINDAVSLLTTTTNEQMKHLMAKWHPETVVDSHLFSIMDKFNDANRPDHGTASVKWVAFDSKIRFAAQRRDVCMIEYTGTVRDPVTNQIVGFHVNESIDLPEWPRESTFVNFGLTRANVQNVYLFYPPEEPTITYHSTCSSKHGLIRMCSFGHFQHGGYTAEWINMPTKPSLSFGVRGLCYKTFFKQTAQRLISLLHPLDRLMICTPEHCVPLRNRKFCYCCQCLFGLLSARSNCLSCGEVFCRNCLLERLWSSSAKKESKSITSLKRTSNSDLVSTEIVKVCVLCMDNAANNKGKYPSQKISTLGHSKFRRVNSGKRRKNNW